MMNQQEQLDYLLKKVESLEEKIRDYEKSIPYAEVVDNEPVEYEPLFPVLEGTDDDTAISTRAVCGRTVQRCDYYPNGNTKYFGYWKNGMRNGSGKSFYPDGQTKYDGQWKDNMRNGYGKCYYPDGGLYYEGDWQNNKPYTYEQKARYKVLQKSQKARYKVLQKSKKTHTAEEKAEYKSLKKVLVSSVNSTMP